MNSTGDEEITSSKVNGEKNFLGTLSRDASLLHILYGGVGYLLPS